MLVLWEVGQGFWGIGGEDFKRVCVPTSGYPSWGPMGPQEVQNEGFGDSGGCLHPYFKPSLSFPDPYRGDLHNL